MFSFLGNILDLDDIKKISKLTKKEKRKNQDILQKKYISVIKKTRYLQKLKIIIIDQGFLVLIDAISLLI